MKGTYVFAEPLAGRLNEWLPLKCVMSHLINVIQHQRSSGPGMLNCLLSILPYTERLPFIPQPQGKDAE